MLAGAGTDAIAARLLVLRQARRGRLISRYVLGRRVGPGKPPLPLLFLPKLFLQFLLPLLISVIALGQGACSLEVTWQPLFRWRRFAQRLR